MKRLRMLLVLVAMLAWGRVVQVLILPNFDFGNNQTKLSALILPILDWGTIASPFPPTGTIEAQPKVHPTKSALPKNVKASTDSTPPPSLQAIVWGPDPVAILVRGSSSEILHKGEAFDGWKVLSIASDRIKIAKGLRKIELVDQ